MSNKIEKKKFKDTKLGYWLKEKAPNILNQVGEFLPDSGYIGIVKRGIEILSPEDKEEGQKQLEKLKTKLTQIDLENARIELEETKAILLDKANARETEINRKKPSPLMTVLGFGMLGCYIGLLLALIFLKIPIENKDQLIHMEGIMEGGLLAMIAYFFGGDSLRKEDK